MNRFWQGFPVFFSFTKNSNVDLNIIRSRSRYDIDSELFLMYYIFLIRIIQHKKRLSSPKQAMEFSPLKYNIHLPTMI